jgi:hypothetical protein
VAFGTPKIKSSRSQPLPGRGFKETAITAGLVMGDKTKKEELNYAKPNKKKR